MMNPIGHPHPLTRREFLWLSSLTAAGFAAGCAVNPVTGENQLMLVSETDEIQMDRQASPHQFSSDFGVSRDARLNRYVAEVGGRLAGLTHRPRMPYNFKVVNATYVNAYAFPGGSIAVTRGILLKLDNEAELASLLGHELGHVNARHTAQQMSKGQMTALVLGGVQAAIGSQYADITQALGSLGAGLLLASYSRDNERQADDLGNQYMVKAGYNTDGFVGLMDMLNSLSKSRPGYAAVLFSTHPMSDERYQTAVVNARTRYQATRQYPLSKERYMDAIAPLRAIEDAIADIQSGDEAMGKKDYSTAEALYKKAFKKAPDDYAGLVKMAYCQMEQKKAGEAIRYARSAQQVYPNEAQAYLISGFARLNTQQYDQALEDFSRYDQFLPGNPSIIFYKGYALEQSGRREQAAQAYQKYLQVVREGPQAQHAYTRLVQWGYIRQ